MITVEQFTEWVNYHCSFFPQFRTWLDGDDRIRPNSVYKTFKVFTLDELRNATDQLHEEDPDAYPNKHRAMIFDIANKDREKVKQEERFAKLSAQGSDYSFRDSYTCPKCRDTGRLFVYHPKAYRPIKDGSVKLTDIGECVVACSFCEAGEVERDRVAIRGKFKGLPMFDDARMCLVTKRLPEEQLAELTSFVKGE